MHATAFLFDLLIVFSDPDPHNFADMPGRIIPNQQPGALALRRQPLAALVENLGGHVADGTFRHKT